MFRLDKGVRVRCFDEQNKKQTYGDAEIHQPTGLYDWYRTFHQFNGGVSHFRAFYLDSVQHCMVKLSSYLPTNEANV